MYGYRSPEKPSGEDSRLEMFTYTSPLGYASLPQIHLVVPSGSVSLQPPLAARESGVQRRRQREHANNCELCVLLSRELTNINAAPALSGVHTSAMNLNALFPSVIPPPPSHLSPARWPGIDTKSSEALAKTLKEDVERYHVFFNDRGFHK